MRVLVGYATCHGSTRGIAEAFAARLEAHGIPADCRAMDEVGSLEGYDAAVLGSAIHERAWLPEAANFVARIAREIGERPVWLFSVGMPASLPGRMRGWAMQEEPLVLASLEPATRPRGHRLLAGVVEREHLSSRGRAAFRMLGGRYGDYRDWGEVEAFADEVAGALQAFGATSSRGA